jgi:tetratricopeptide (TPR) repeat protein
MAEPRRRAMRPLRLGLAIAAIAAMLPSAARAAEGAVPVQTGIELSSSTQQALARLQEQWLQWVSAFYQNDPARAGAALNDLQAAARQLGMARLPDLSLAALTRAVESARSGNFERAGWALDAAGKLDAGRPEEAFAQAVVARLQGSYVRALLRHLEGWRRVAATPLLRELWLASLAIWLSAALLAAAALFLALQMATKGGALWRDLIALLSLKLPRRVAQAVAVIVLLWPLALPKGLLWLTLFWSALLWSYVSRSERLVFACLWLAVALVPASIATGQRRLLAHLSPPGQALSQFAERRLSGGLFTDFGVLRSMLPQSIAGKQVLADLHRTLGQWELARPIYLEVVDAEPGNATALIDLGNYFFRRGDFGKAVEYYRRASEAAPTNPASYYNLSQAYSESYLFDESRQALARARQVGEGVVSKWVQEARSERVLSFDGGLARRAEIDAQLVQAIDSESGARPSPWWYYGVPALAAALLAVTLWMIRLRRGLEADVEPQAPRWLRILLPGLASIERGAGPAGFLALLAFTALLLVLPSARPGVPIPWGFDPGNGLLWLIFGVGLAALYGIRLQRELRPQED